MIVQPTDFDGLVSSSELVKVEGHHPFESLEGRQATVNGLVSGFHPFAVVEAEFNLGHRTCLTPSQASEFVKTGGGVHARVENVDLRRNINGSRQVLLSEEHRHLDGLVSVHHAPTEITVPERVDLRCGSLAAAFGREFENFFHFSRRQVGVCLNHHGEDTRDGGGGVRRTGTAPRVAVVFGRAPEQVDTPAGGYASFGLDNVRARCGDFRLEFVKRVTVTVVPARSTGGVTRNGVVASVDGVLIVRGAHRDGETGRAHAREPVVVGAVVASGDTDDHAEFHGLVEDAAVHVLAVRTTAFVGRDAPRERDDVDAVIGFVGALPGGVAVVDDPLQPVHGRFIELLSEQVILERSCAGVGADANVHEVGVRG